MLAQFRDRYPTGGLISKLLQIHDGHYIVQVSLEVDGVTLSTGMAAAPTVEEAEDRARTRAFDTLGLDINPTLSASITSSHSSHSIEPNNPGPSNQQPSQLPLKSPPIAPADLTPAANLNPLADPTVTANALNSPSVDRKTNHQNGSSQSADRTEMAQLSLAERTPAASCAPTTPTSISPAPTSAVPTSSAPTSAVSAPSLKNEDGANRSAAKPSEETPTHPATPTQHLNQAANNADEVSLPVDFSDVIAKTSIELKRLQWSNEKGREYLKTAYGKVSRQRLTDEELLDFLHHLESLP